MSAEAILLVNPRRGDVTVTDVFYEAVRASGADVEACQSQAHSLAGVLNIPLEDAMDAMAQLLHRQAARRDNAVGPRVV